MKFALTPLKNRRLMYPEDETYLHTLGMKIHQDIRDGDTGEWHRIYSDVILFPKFAQHLYQIAQESYQLEDGYRCPVEYVHPYPPHQPVITHKVEDDDFYYLELNNGSEWYYYT